ncbi:MAG: universal stress protein [Flavobacteriaceae bacterium]|nr:universal stress protein [Flavobacteriaceae bacterium]
MKRKILLPTDFSENSWNAIKYAIELFENETCDFYLLNVFSTIGFASDNIMVPEMGEIAFNSVKKNSEKGLDKFLYRISLRKDNPNHEFFTISMYDTLLYSIKEVVEKNTIDLIIMGTKGSSNVLTAFFGSNTVTVMEKVRNCPVIAIPEKTNFKTPYEIVFPTSLKTQYNSNELQQLVDIASLNNSTIRILHIQKENSLDEEQLNNKKILRDNFGPLEHSFHYIRDVDLYTSLYKFIEIMNTDMIVFINKEHSFFENIFSNPMVKELGYHSKIPVLTLHDFKK